MTIDVTERRQSEERLRRASLYTRGLIEASLDPLVTISPDGKITDVNVAIERATGLPRAELVGTDFSDYFTEPERAKTGYRRVLDEGMVRDYPLVIRSVSGVTTEVLYNATVYRDESDATVGVFAAARDVTGQRATERALRDSERLFSGFMRWFPGLAYIKDPDGHLVFANEGFATYLGMEPSSMVGKTNEDLFPPEHAAKFTADDQAVIASGQVQTIEEELADRTWRSVKFPIATDAGPPLLAGLGVDVTEERRAEAALEERRRFVEGIVEALQDALTVVTPNGRRILVNRAFSEITGFSKEEVLGSRPPSPWWPPEHLEEIGATFGQALRGEVFDAELVLMRKDGERFPAAMSASTVYDHEGGAAYHVLSFKDISERKKAERELLESQHFVESILETTPSLVYIYDLEQHRNVYANRELGHILGYSQQDVADMGDAFMSKLAHPDDLGLIAEHHQRLMAAGDEVITLEYRMRDSQERWRVIRNTDKVFVRNDDGSARQIIGAAEDMTERKAAEEEIKALNVGLEKRVAQRTAELERANASLGDMINELTRSNADLEIATKAKSEFLAAMSHDLRTPMNSILGFSGVMLQELSGPLNDEQRRQVTMINNSGRHLLVLINHVLDLSRIESGRLTLAFEACDITDIARAVADTVRAMAQDKGLDLRVDVSDECGAITTDRTRVEQVLLNLLGNAVKFTDTGHIGLSVRPERNGCFFSITDTGCGIRPEDTERIFDDFFQVRRPSVAKEEGTGLGLAVSRRLVRALGGEICVRSAVGAGSTFEVWLPRAAPDAASEAAPGEQTR